MMMNRYKGDQSQVLLEGIQPSYKRAMEKLEKIIVNQTEVMRLMTMKI
ncbi:hypothetical protein Goklo_022009, partial [Gossypium klotzschianum]|nr:hypothetical protein [Gossypium klotzschianum]